MTLWAVFLASVLGSLHCGAMCGGFAAAVCGGGGGGSSWRGIWSFHLGRGFAYLGLGVLAGLGAQHLGSLDARASAWLGVVLGMGIIAMGIGGYWATRAKGVSGTAQRPVTLGRRGPQKRNHNVLAKVRAFAARQWATRGLPGIGLAGAATALLPCGWLWSHVLVAASQSDVSSAVSVMAAFWLGTLPILISIGLWSRGLMRRWGRHAPLVSALILTCLGIVTIAQKLTLLDESEPYAVPSCHAQP